MRLLALVVLAACGSSAAPKPVAHVAPASEGVRITLAPPAVGDRRTVTSTMRMDADTTFPDGSARRILAEQTVVEEIEVLEVSGGSEQKVKVTYPLARMTRSMGEIRSKEDKPLAGHTYIVWTEGGEIRATRDDGAALRSNEEQELVEEWDDDLGRTDPFREIVAGQAWTLGARHALGGADLARLDFGDDAIQVTSASIALAATSADTATFELDVEMDGREEQTSMTMSGRVRLEVERRTGRLITITMTGPIKGRTDGIALDGTMGYEQRATYR